MVLEIRKIFLGCLRCNRKTFFRVVENSEDHVLVVCNKCGYSKKIIGGIPNE